MYAKTTSTVPVRAPIEDILDVSFSAHGNPSVLAELEYFLSLPAPPALPRVDYGGPILRLVRTRGVLAQAIPVQPARGDLPAVIGCRQAMLASFLHPRGADQAQPDPWNVCLSPLYRRTEDAYAQAVDLESALCSPGTGGDRFPYLASRGETLVLPGYTRGIAPVGYERVSRESAVQEAGIDCALFGAFTVSRRSGAAAPSVFENLSRRFPTLLLTSMAVAVLGVRGAGGTPPAMEVQVWGCGQNLQSASGMLPPGTKGATSPASVDALLDRVATCARTLTDGYLNGIRSGPSARDPTAGESRYEGGITLWAPVDSEPPRAACELAAQRNTVLGSEAPPFGRFTDYGIAMQAANGYKWPDLLQLAASQGLSAIADLHAHVLKGGNPRRALMDLRQVCRAAQTPYGLTVLDVLLASRTVNENLAFDSRKLPAIARFVSEDPTHVFAELWADRWIGRLMDGLYLTAYLCLSEDPRLHRPLSCTPQDAQEEARRLAKDEAPLNSTLPAPVHDTAWQAVLDFETDQKQPGLFSGPCRAPRWMTPEYAGFLRLLKAQHENQDALHVLVRPGAYDCAADLGRPLSRTRGVKLLRWRTQDLTDNRLLDSLMLMVASGHPDGFRIAVNNKVPLRLAILSVARSVTGMQEYIEEFGLSRFPAGAGPRCVLDADGTVLGRAGPDRNEGSEGENLRGSWQALRTEQQLRAALVRTPLKTVASGAGPALDIL